MTSHDDTADAPARQPWQLPSWYRRIGLASWFFIGVVISTAVLAALMSAMSSIVAPLTLGALLAVVFLPLVDWLEDRSLPRALAAIIVLVVLVASVVAIAWWMIIAIWGQGDEIASLLDAAVVELRELANDSSIDPELIERVESFVSGAAPALGSGLAAVFVSVLDSAVGLIAGSILGAIVMYYLLKDGPVIGGRWVSRSPDSEASRRRLGERVVRDVRNYFRGRTLLAATNGIGIGLGVAAMGIPAAGAIAVVNFVGGYVPYLGAFIGGGFAVLMALGDGGPGPAIASLALVLVVNIGLENLLEPKLLGSSLNLHPLTILLATTLGGMVAGMVGLILAAPVVAIGVDLKKELTAVGFFDDDDDG